MKRPLNVFGPTMHVRTLAEPWSSVRQPGGSAVKRGAGLRQLGVVLGLVSVWCCASVQPTHERDSLYGGDAISEREVAGKDFSTAYDAIRRLRPPWLRPHAAPSFANSRSVYPTVFVDRIMASGGLEALLSIPIGDVSEIHFLNGRDATTQFGTGHMGGAILVETKRGGSPPPPVPDNGLPG